MNIRCECGKFQGRVENFPKDTPGRCVCYCDDCQTYLHFLKRTDLLDSAGGTEIVPVYPNDLKILAGKEFIQCVRLAPKGLYRWFTSCCQTPLANTKPGFPWAGMSPRVFTVDDPKILEKTLGPIKIRIQGRFARKTPPPGTSQSTAFRDFRVVLPFILKGLLLGKAKKSPFFESDSVTSIATPKILTLEERNKIRQELKTKH